MSTGSVDIAITDIDDKLNSLPQTTSKPSIPRIYSDYRRVGSDTIYDPEMLSIGPYHHGNPRLQNMEQVKYMYLKRVLKRRNELSVDRYVTAVAAMEKQARQCYTDPINLDENQFVTLLVVDAIFIIEFLLCCCFENLRDADDSIIFNHKGVLTLLSHDILLLENQLPMFILSQLFNMIKTNNDNDLGFIKLAFLFFGGVSSRSFLESPFLDADVPRIDHLCGLLHGGQCLPFVKTLSAPSNGSWENINSASGLREAGIKFQAASEEGILMNIKFVKGVLMIPKLKLYDESESYFRNLIVYEQYLPQRIRRCFTDYAFFIRSLIKTSDDADLLSSHGIILNSMGSDEEICQMFNRLVRNTMLSSDFTYSQVFRSLNSHCSRRRNRWKANLRKNYFNSPWSVISFVAASVLLIFTIAQTIYTILGYYYR